MSLRRKRGFTLIELVIALGIVGLLAAIAYPAYTSHMGKGRRAAAKAELMRLALAEEKWRANHSTYSDAIATTALDDYTISFTPAPTDTSFSIVATATPGGAQADDAEDSTSCTTLSIDESGNKFPSDCW
ncbi:MAG: type IV pilin protein [Methylococcaceae bacterium]|nr:MAG: type IV pilin protein [Methylococcaceae bacterium]